MTTIHLTPSQYREAAGRRLVLCTRDPPRRRAWWRRLAARWLGR